MLNKQTILVLTNDKTNYNLVLMQFSIDKST